MKKCNFCGAELNDDSTICPVCGKSIEDTSNADAASSQDEVAVIQPLCSEESETVDETLLPFVSEAVTDSVKAELEVSLKEKKKTKRRKSLFFVLLAAVLAAAIFCIIFFSSPKYKVLAAAKNTFADLNEFSENCENYKAASAISNDLLSGGKYSYDIAAIFQLDPEFDDYNSELYDELYGDYTVEDLMQLFSARINMKLDYDKENKVFASSANVMLGDEDSVSIDMSVNEEQTMYRLPEISQDVYGFNNATFGSDLVDSSLYDSLGIYGISKRQLRDLSIEPFVSDEENAEKAQQIKDSIITLLSSVEIKKSSSRIVDFDGTVYRLYVDGKDIKAFIKDFIVISTNNPDILNQPNVRKMLKQVRNAEYKLYLGVNDGKIEAISVKIGSGVTYSLVLSDSNNVWNDFSVFLNNREFMRGGLNNTEKGYEIKIKGSQTNFGIVWAVDDKAGEAVLTVSAFRTKTDLIKLNYSSNKDSASYSLEVTPGDIFYIGNLESLSFDISISPLEKTPEMLADEAISILTLSEEELDVLIEKIADTMEENNPELANVLDRNA